MYHWYMNSLLLKVDRVMSYHNERTGYEAFLQPLVSTYPLRIITIPYRHHPERGEVQQSPSVVPPPNPG